MHPLRWLFSLLLASTLAVAASVDSLANQKIVVLGDSITQGGGYVSFMDYYLQKLRPQARFEVYPLGLSSETVSGLSEPGHAGGKFARPALSERLPRVLEKMRPDVVFACYGMNDGIYQPLEEKRFQAFKDGINHLLDSCQKAGVKRIILVTPPSTMRPPRRANLIMIRCSRPMQRGRKRCNVRASKSSTFTRPCALPARNAPRSSQRIAFIQAMKAIS